MVEPGFAAKAAQLHALAGELAAAVSADTSGLLATEVLPEVFGAGRQLDLLTCRLVERADRSDAFRADGAGSITQYVMNTSGQSRGWASKRVHLGRALADLMPMTSKGWETGDLGIDHAQKIADTIRGLDRDLACDMEAFLAEHAAVLTVEQLKTVCAELLAAAAPDKSDADAATKRAGQHLNLSETLAGMWRLDGWLDPEAGQIVANAIAAFLRKPDPDGDVLTESVGSRRAEALVQLARHGTAHAESCNGEGGNRYDLVIGVSHQTLVDNLGVGGTPEGQRFTAGTLRRLACDAGIIPTIYGTDSEILDFGRRTRTISPGLRHFIVARDGGCVFPGCGRPPSFTEVHHREHWVEHQGETEPENLEMLCTHHHHAVHEGGWTITIAADRDRTPWFHPPNGRPPLRGQRRPLLRPASDIPRRT